MNSIITKDIKTLFFNKNSTYSTEQYYNLILSPEYYWFRVFEIPADSKKQVLKLLPTLFEDILPNSSFEYHAIKIEDKKFMCFAYKSSEIVNDIKKSGLSVSKLKNIFFCQTELITLSPFKIGNFAYTVQDKSIIQIPLKFAPEDIPILNLSNVSLSNNKVKLNLYQNVINTKNIYIISILIFILLSINIFSIINITNTQEKLFSEKTELLNKHALPLTSIQLNSMISSLSKVNKKQNKIRDALKSVLSIYKSFPNFQLKSIKYNEKLIIEVENINFIEIKKYFDKYKIKQLSNKQNILQVEIII